MKKIHLLMNSVTDTNQGGNGAAPTQTSTATAEAQGSTGSIEQMYGVQTQPAAAPAGQQTAAATQQQTQEGTPAKKDDGKSATGYTVPPAGSAAGYGADAGKTAGEQQAPAAQAPASEIKFDETGLKKEQIESIKKFATENKLSQEAIDNFASVAKLANGQLDGYKAAQKQQIEQAKAKQRNDWTAELQNDPNFGGSNFEQSLKRVDTVLEKHFPNTKKMLTKSGGMLPPDVMKDLVAIHTSLYGQEGQLVNPSGDAMNANLSQADKFLKEFYK